MELKWQTRVIVKYYIFCYLFIRSVVVMELNIYLLGYLLNVTLYVFCKSTCPLNALNRRNFDSCASTRSRKRRKRSPSAAAAAPRASCAFRNRNLCSLAANNYFSGKIQININEINSSTFKWFVTSSLHLSFKLPCDLFINNNLLDAVYQSAAVVLTPLPLTRQQLAYQAPVIEINELN